MTVGLSTTFQLFQAQRDLSQQQLAELNAIIAYNRALVNFDAVQIVPVRAVADRGQEIRSRRSRGMISMPRAPVRLSGSCSWLPAR